MKRLLIVLSLLSFAGGSFAAAPSGVSQVSQAANTQEPIGAQDVQVKSTSRATKKHRLSSRVAMKERFNKVVLKNFLK